MQNLPIFIPILFVFTTLLSVALFYKASNQSLRTLLLLIIWLTIQAIIGLSGFYTIENTLPPRFIGLVLPPFLLILGLFLTQKGREYIDSLDIKTLTLFHFIRFFVEIVLFQLSIYKVVPDLMTFEGRNFDILAGITAPFVYYFGFIKNQLSRKVLLAWNIVCVFLLLNIVINAILSAPTQFQQFAFEQPNIAVLYFPYLWLPCCLVPLVLFSHLATIRHLRNGKYGSK